MGLLEQVNYRLSLICAALNIALTDDTVGVVETVTKLPPIETVVIPGMAPAAVTAAVLGTTVPAAPVGAPRVTVKQALAAGAKLTGAEIDEQGCYWAKDINTSVPAVTQKNIWKRGKSIDDTVYDNRIAAIKTEVAGAAVTLNVTPETVGSVLPLPGAGATLPLPTVGTLPLPGASAVHQSSLEDPIRKEVIAGMGVLTNKYGIDFSVISILLMEHGAKNGTFPELQDAVYPEVNKKLNQWAIAYDMVDDADEAVRGMNGNDPTYLMTLMTQLKLGTQDLSTVQHRDLYRLYQNVHAYQNQLEAHFQKPLTPVQPDPFAS